MPKDQNLFLKDVQRVPYDTERHFCLDGDVNHTILTCPLGRTPHYGCSEFCIMCRIVPGVDDPSNEFLYCSYIGKPIAFIHPPDPKD
jgi:hypothetical protein